MIRYFLYLLAYIPLQLFAYLITPILPLFKTVRYGALDNANGHGYGYRLPLFLSWLDTPDNPITGDGNWNRTNGDGYLSLVGWLYRNSLYGFKWSVMAMPIDIAGSRWEGNPSINYHTKEFGSLRITQPNGAWQFKLVRPLFGKILVLNFGWLLDDTSKEKALWMFSPRIK